MLANEKLEENLKDKRQVRQLGMADWPPINTVEHVFIFATYCRCTSRRAVILVTNRTKAKISFRLYIHSSFICSTKSEKDFKENRLLYQLNYYLLKHKTIKQ